MTKAIDLNCDLGEWRSSEGSTTDARIMPFISSCNIACGGHIGDEYTMKKTVELALQHEVKIGAHPSYPDTVNFGRFEMHILPSRLFESISNQIFRLQSIAHEMGTELHHIKPHGALYNVAARDETTAEVIVNTVGYLFPGIPVFAPFSSKLAEIAPEFNIRIIAEVFADRAYEDDLSLLSRSLEGAVLHQTDEVLEHVRSMVMDGEVCTLSGARIPIKAETMCLHSDTEGSIQLAQEIHQFLTANNVTITSP